MEKIPRGFKPVAPQPENASKQPGDSKGTPSPFQKLRGLLTSSQGKQASSLSARKVEQSVGARINSALGEFIGNNKTERQKSDLMLMTKPPGQPLIAAVTSMLISTDFSPVKHAIVHSNLIRDGLVEEASPPPRPFERVQTILIGDPEKAGDTNMLLSGGKNQNESRDEARIALGSISTKLAAEGFACADTAALQVLTQAMVEVFNNNLAEPRMALVLKALSGDARSMAKLDDAERTWVGKHGDRALQNLREFATAPAVQFHLPPSKSPETKNPSSSS